MSTPTETTTPAPSAPAPGTPEHDAAMAARFDSAQANAGAPDSTTTPAAKPERPADVPEKFWDAEKGVVKYDDLLASYKALEGKQSTGEKTDGKPAQEATPAAAATDAAKALEEVGLSYDKYAQEFATTGKLSEEAYAEMAAKNIPKAVVDAHVKALVTAAEAEASALRNEVFKAAGGEEKYTEVATWAAANLSMAEKIAFNEAIEGNVETAKLTIAGLVAKFEAANGKEPTLINGGGQRVAGDVFRSTAELTSAMRDPRYDKDPAYRADVEAKLSRSNIM